MALWGFRAKCWSGWVSGFEEKEGVMRNAMTTRAPGGANKPTEVAGKVRTVSLRKRSYQRIQIIEVSCVVEVTAEYGSQRPEQLENVNFVIRGLKSDIFY